jgi:hypothetical protein
MPAHDEAIPMEEPITANVPGSRSPMMCEALVLTM